MTNWEKLTRDAPHPSGLNRTKFVMLVRRRMRTNKGGWDLLRLSPEGRNASKGNLFHFVI